MTTREQAEAIQQHLRKIDNELECMRESAEQKHKQLTGELVEISKLLSDDIGELMRSEKWNQSYILYQTAGRFVVDKYKSSTVSDLERISEADTALAAVKAAMGGE